MSPPSNRLLAALPPAVRERLAPREERVRLRDALFRYNDTIEDVFFPHRGTVISLTRGTPDGGMIEVGVAGSEGFAGLHPLLTSTQTRNDGIVQIEGAVSRVSVHRLRDELDDRGTRDLVLAYASLYLDLVTQNVVCNRLHSIEQRLAKWLLIMRDRSGADRLSLTHEFLSQMLGVRRAGVSIAIGALELDALVDHSRSQVTLTDVVGLKARSCACYDITAVALAEYEQRLAHTPA